MATSWFAKARCSDDYIVSKPEVQPHVFQALSFKSHHRLVTTPSALRDLTQSQLEPQLEPEGRRTYLRPVLWERPTMTINVFVQTPNGNTINFEILDRDQVGKLKDNISVKTSIPCDHQMLRIAGKPYLDLYDYCEISKYNKWKYTELDMVLEERSGEFYVSVFDSFWMEQKEIILKLSHNDTIKTVKDQILTKMKLREPKKMRLYYERTSNPKACGESYKIAFQEWRHSCFSPFYNKSTDGIQQELCDNMRTLEYYNMSLFWQLLNFRVCLIHIEDDGARHVYSVQLSDVLDASHNEYLLSVEYNTTVNKFYSLVADHYKISVERIVLMVNHCRISDGDTRLYRVFYHPIIMEDPVIRYSSILFSGFLGCYIPEHCELAKKIVDDPIVKKVVGVRNDTWEVIIKVFNITDEVKKEIEENSEDVRIRCMDVMHRMYHHDNDLTWEFVEMQVRKEDPQLADVIRAQL